MRKICNVSDEELTTLKVLRKLDAHVAKTLQSDTEYTTVAKNILHCNKMTYD